MSAGAVRRAPEVAQIEAARYDAVARVTCDTVIRHYSTSFRLACRLLGEPVRDHVRAIYALVRLADELVDNPKSLLAPDRARVLLDRLEAETLDALQHGTSANLVVHGFARTARRCGIDADLVQPFFASMRADLDVTSHDQESFDRYVYGSAEVVGLMCLRAFLADERGHDVGSRYADLAPGAQRLGAAFQKANFLRDLAADRQVRGRTYFPGLEGTCLTDADKNRLLDDVDADLSAATAVIGQLPISSRRGVAVASALFGELSARLRATPAAQIVERRVRVPTPVKARVVASTLLALRR